MMRYLLLLCVAGAAAIAIPVLPAAYAQNNLKQARPYEIVDTNQRQCYDASGRGPLEACPSAGDPFFGQDANYVINLPRYVINDDGTVSDKVTGLQWQKGFIRGVEWSEAEQYARKADLAGHNDWRAPTIKELYSLIAFSGDQGAARPSAEEAPADARPFIDTDVFDFEYPTVNRYIDAQYITSTVYSGRAMEQKAFFGVNFADGRIKGYPQRHRNGAWYLKLVRGNPDYGKNIFQDNGDDTVTDLATGLTWMQSDSGGSTAQFVKSAVIATHYFDGRMDWTEALAFCEGLTLAGADDWRLPNAKELQSIVDYDRSPDASNSAAIDPVFDVTEITDEAGQADYPGYWTSTTLLAGPDKGKDGVVFFFGRALGMNRSGAIIDAHGAGAQRSDPKIGNPDAYPQWGHGPQGDVVRVYNYVRCVRSDG
ncbi:MAG: DUF1566 domain-containing protein [Pseudomonadota bacterium]